MTTSTQLLRDLNEAYFTIVRDNQKKGIIMSRRQICELIARSPAPRLYITPDRARRLMFNYTKYRARKYQASGKHEEFYRRYQQLPKEQRNSLNIQNLIDQPAPSFYLTAAYIDRFLYKIHDNRK